MVLDDHTVAELLELPTGNVADSCPAGCVMDADIKPLDTGFKIVGRARTVRCHPGDNLALYQGIDAARSGDVLMFDCSGFAAGHFGDMMARACKAKGVIGVVIDGTCRDRNDICEVDLPVFSRGLCPAGTTKACPGEVDADIVIGGVRASTGDLIFADCDGVVVVPHMIEDTVFAKALAKHEREEHIAERLAAGESILSIYGFDKLLEKLGA